VRERDRERGGSPVKRLSERLKVAKPTQRPRDSGICPVESEEGCEEEGNRGTSEFVMTQRDFAKFHTTPQRLRNIIWRKK
jgi:hypothetical protein